MDPVVLRLPRVDVPQDESQFVLVHVTSAGRRPLDLDLIGTDNNLGFAVSLRHQPSSLGEKNSSINQEDWEAILEFILLGTAAPESLTKDLEAVAKLNRNLIITLQKRVEGITHKLGAFTLTKNDAALDGIDLFEWCGLALTAKRAIENELQSQQKALRQNTEQVQKLEVKLAELEKLKNAHENDLLEKFSLLLNEKKLKIRDQQRLLASSNVEPARLADVEESRSGRAHSAGPSGKGKRKADARVETDDEESDGFENMEVDEAPESEQDQPQTPQDESTADEASEDEAPVSAPTRSNRQKSPVQASSSIASPPPKDAVLSPKRDLPFQRKPAAKPAPVLDGSETESDDDEL
ncbi:hypothetical protein L207DRAFT_513302 [Hyaloscypha variabilis F]|uniref:Uncharacterized protein n=1 Tax=Hyaloscypha variabilis (strain UAMH 11265 / GT02V1 / F) TaxID=1149755 RepID=A0A2J6RJY9_HYAVF|nr:hypothetical protein L207DRAFT_513302 [Hyaloscypha variabilis F]